MARHGTALRCATRYYSTVAKIVLLYCHFIFNIHVCYTLRILLFCVKYVFGYHIKDSLVLKELLIEKMAKNLSKMGGTRVVLQMIFC